MILNNETCSVRFARVMKMPPSFLAAFKIYTLDVCADRKIKEGLDDAKMCLLLLERKGEKRWKAWVISGTASAQQPWFLKKWSGLSEGAAVIHVVCPCSSANCRVTNRGQLVEMKTITKIQILHFLSLFQGMRAQIGSQPKDKYARRFCKTNPCTEERQKPTSVQRKIFLNCNQEIHVTAAISSHTAAVNPGQQDTHTSWWSRAWMLQTAMHF